MSLEPINISTSSGLTEATFSKNGLKQGYWFYGYADSGRGGIVRADGLREFLSGPALVQNDVNINSFNNVWLHTSEDLITMQSLYPIILRCILHTSWIPDLTHFQQYQMKLVFLPTL